MSKQASARSGATFTVELETAEGLAFVQTARALMHREKSKVPPGTRELCERVAKQIVSSARIAMTQAAPIKHTGDYHESLKRDDLAWSKLAPVGTQVVEPTETEPGYTLELRNCRCGSTLAREVKP